MVVGWFSRLGRKGDGGEGREVEGRGNGAAEMEGGGDCVAHKKKGDGGSSRF